MLFDKLMKFGMAYYSIRRYNFRTNCLGRTAIAYSAMQPIQLIKIKFLYGKFVINEGYFSFFLKSINDFPCSFKFIIKSSS